jgi:hypothetical protein
MPRPLYPQGNSLRYPLYRRLSGPQSRSGRYREEKNLFTLPGLEPRLLIRPSHSLVFIWLGYLISAPTIIIMANDCFHNKTLLSGYHSRLVFRRLWVLMGALRPAILTEVSPWFSSVPPDNAGNCLILRHKRSFYILPNSWSINHPTIWGYIASAIDSGRGS